ncbi:hypothetical protein [Streptomyces lanatus]|uniref:Uncharacterized protein n=1 Tax=Streptomyces lanatus TaxID=66900 RepID=A0ABV1Y2Z8_9ACTN|nr:hypothetical protein [Streptomyces lanatus]
MGRALWLASNARAGRSIGWWAWVFWAVDDIPDSAQRLREALVAALKRRLVSRSTLPNISHRALSELDARLLLGGAADIGLCHARRTCTKATVVLKALMRRAPEAPMIMTLLMTMPEWATDPDRCLSFPDNMLVACHMPPGFPGCGTEA